MPKTIETVVYTYDELPTEKAKENARGWFTRDLDLSYIWDDIKSDAKEIGLEIIELHQHKHNKGEFINSAPECAETIIANHGNSCETYKTAKGYLDALQKLGDRPSDTIEDADDNEYEDAREELDNEFMQSLLGDYWNMCQAYEDDAYSQESVEDNIRCNEYTFTETGKHFG